MFQKIRNISPYIIILLLTVILFSPYFLSKKYPIPGDIIIGHYHPWVDNIWDSKAAGYPIKNFSIYDSVRQLIPWRLLSMDLLHQGIMPLWNQYTFSGTPLLGNIQSAVLYPLNFLFFLFSFWDAWTIYIMLQPLLAAFFTFLFLSNIKLSRKASLFGAIAYGFSSIMMNHLELGINGHTSLWLPLGLLAINLINEKNLYKGVLIFLFSVFMCSLGGYPPLTIYNFVIWSLYILFKIKPFFSKKYIILLFGFLLAVMLAAPQLLPTYELSKNISRDESQFGYLNDNEYFLPVENLIMTIAPDYFGHPSTNNVKTPSYFTENSAIGIIGILMVLYVCINGFRLKESRFWSLLALLIFILMVKNPISVIYAKMSVPILSMVSPIKMVWSSTFALSVLAAIGLDSVFVNGKKERRRYFLPIIILWIIIFLLWLGSFIFLQGRGISIAQRNMIIPTLLLFAASLLLFILYRFPKYGSVICLLLILLSSGELVRQGIKYNPFIESNLIYPTTKMINYLYDNLGRTIVTHQDIMSANMNIPYKISMIDGYASMYDGRYGELVHLANDTPPITEISTYPRIVFQAESNYPIINLLNVKYVLTLEEENENNLKLLSTEGKTFLYENLNVFPRVFFVNQFLFGKDKLDIANKMLVSDLRRTVILERDLSKSFEKSDSPSAEVISYHGNDLLIKTMNDKEGILVLSESYDKGWNAYIDGQKTDIFRADYDLQAIIVPEGKHAIKFTYDPKSFKIGLILSGSAALIIMVGILLKIIWKKK